MRGQPNEIFMNALWPHMVVGSFPVQAIACGGCACLENAVRRRLSERNATTRGRNRPQFELHRNKFQKLYEILEYF